MPEILTNPNSGRLLDSDGNAIPTIEELLGAGGAAIFLPSLPEMPPAPTGYGKLTHRKDTAMVYIKKDKVHSILVKAKQISIDDAKTLDGKPLPPDIMVLCDAPLGNVNLTGEQVTAFNIVVEDDIETVLKELSL